MSNLCSDDNSVCQQTIKPNMKNKTTIDVKEKELIKAQKVDLNKDIKSNHNSMTNLLNEIK